MKHLPLNEDPAPSPHMRALSPLPQPQTLARTPQPAPIRRMRGRTGGQRHLPLGTLLSYLVILVAALSAMNSQLYITTRMMFSLSRAGYAPRRFGEVSRNGVPVAALMLSTIGIALAVALNVMAPQASFTLMMSVSMFGAMFTWLMIFVTHLYFRRAHDAKSLTFRMWGYPYASLAGALLMLATLVTTYFTGAFRMTLVYGVPFVVALSVVYAVWYRQRAAVATAGAHGSSR